MKRLLTVLIPSIAISVFAVACSQAQTNNSVDISEIATFDKPWSMTFLPDDRILVAEKQGRIAIVGQDGTDYGSVTGLPEVDHGGQGGFGDVCLHPDFESNGLLYFSYAEGAPGDTRGAAVARGKLTLGENGGTLADVEVVWRQYPKVFGRGHYAHRIAFDDDGYLRSVSVHRANSGSRGAALPP